MANKETIILLEMLKMDMVEEEVLVFVSLFINVLPKFSGFRFLGFFLIRASSFGFFTSSN